MLITPPFPPHYMTNLRSAYILFTKFTIDFLSNQWEYQKRLTHFCSSSPADCHCVVCFVVHEDTKGGNSIQQTSLVLQLKACARLPLDQIFKINISSDSSLYKL